MQIGNTSVLITGGASGLGLATVRKLAAGGAQVTVVDLPESAGANVAAEVSGEFVAADITDEEQVRAALEIAGRRGPLRAVVHCAGGPGKFPILDQADKAVPLTDVESVVRLNLLGSYNVLCLAAEAMAATAPVDGERGVCVLTSSVAAFEGQIGQVPYAASKAGIAGLTLAAARDLASRLIRVCTIAPGLFDTWLPPTTFERFATSIPHPNRLGRPAEYALLAAHIIENPMLNGETIRLDAASRLPGS
ncbi:SDR family NAD(P)-dependent oxidoreductase [Nocardia sp. NPDC019395]|uniref:SDR family NAD(P)-dependent oxidoreductase n=1 Tax=Nocardia sp. NPDC019395 TaxID=3154686 RepID=UPI0033DC0250